MNRSDLDLFEVYGLGDSHDQDITLGNRIEAFAYKDGIRND